MPRIEHKTVGRFHVFTSPDVPGLYVAHEDEATARAAVQPTIDALNRITDKRRDEQQDGMRQAICA